jgi:putative flippase GtrA
MVAARIRHLYATFGHLLHEIAKFGVIGAVAFAATVALSNGLRFGAHLGPLTSFGVATVITAIGSYFANRHWTWKHMESHGVHRELPLFLLLSLVGLAISEAPLGVSEYVLHQHSALAYNVSSTLIGTAFGTVWRFWSFKRWVFVAPERERTQEAAREALV